MKLQREWLETEHSQEKEKLALSSLVLVQFLTIYNKGKKTIRLQSTNKYQQLDLISKTPSRAMEFYCSCSFPVPCPVTSLFNLRCMHSAEEALNTNVKCMHSCRTQISSLRSPQEFISNSICFLLAKNSKHANSKLIF